VISVEEQEFYYGIYFQIIRNRPWLRDKKPVSHSEKLRIAIDEILRKKLADFDTFLLQMEQADYSIKQGKHLAFKSKEQKKFIPYVLKYGKHIKKFKSL